MLLAKQRFLFFSVLISCIYVLSWIIQDSLFLNWDVGHLLNSSKLLLAGGNYTHDFFIPNTPTILHLYLPPVIANQLFHLNIVLGFRIYIYLIASLSFMISYFFLRDIFSKKDSIHCYLFMCVLAIAFFLVPLHEFGQRDHLLVIFSMPYLLAVVYQLQGHESRSRYAVIGLFASIGFAIKPQFLITPMLIECYFILFKRSYTAWIRPEVLSIVLFITAYTILTFFLYPDYVLIVVPYLIEFYYQTVNEAWWILLLHSRIIFCYLPIVFYFIHYKENPYKILHTVLLIALISFILSYLSQRTTAYYHFIPALTIALLLLASLLTSMLNKNNISHFNYILLASLSVIFFTFFYLITMLNYHHNLIYYKNVKLKKLIQFIHTQPSSQSIYALSVQGDHVSPLIYYTNLNLPQRFDSLWMVGILAKRIDIEGQQAVRQYIRDNKDPYFFINMIADDLKQHKPALIFVDVRHPNIRFIDQRNQTQTIYFDYLSYFLENIQFKQEWKSYRYLTTLKEDRIPSSLFDIHVYKRIN